MFDFGEDDLVVVGFYLFRDGVFDVREGLFYYGVVVGFGDVYVECVEMVFIGSEWFE